jgi:hypothetical protein
MTGTALTAASVAAFVARTTRASGTSERLTDTGAVARVARLLGGQKRTARQVARRTADTEGHPNDHTAA